MGNEYQYDEVGSGRAIVATTNSKNSATFDNQYLKTFDREEDVKNADLFEFIMDRPSTQAAADLAALHGTYNAIKFKETCIAFPSFSAGAASAYMSMVVNSVQSNPFGPRTNRELIVAKYFETASWASHLTAGRLFFKGDIVRATGQNSPVFVTSYAPNMKMTCLAFVPAALKNMQSETLQIEDPSGASTTIPTTTDPPFMPQMIGGNGYTQDATGSASFSSTNTAAGGYVVTILKKCLFFWNESGLMSGSNHGSIMKNERRDISKDIATVDYLHGVMGLHTQFGHNRCQTHHGVAQVGDVFHFEMGGDGRAGHKVVNVTALEI